MPGEGDVTALPLFRRELRILLSSIFGRRIRSVLLFSRGRTLRIRFSEVKRSFLRADITLFVAGSCYGLLQAVKVWPLQGPNPHNKFHLYARHNQQETGDRTTMKTALPGLLEVMVVRWYVTMLGLPVCGAGNKTFWFYVQKKNKTI